VREPTPYKEGTQELDKSVGLEPQANPRAIRGQAIAQMAGKRPNIPVTFKIA